MLGEDNVQNEEERMDKVILILVESLLKAFSFWGKLISLGFLKDENEIAYKNGYLDV